MSRSRLRPSVVVSGFVALAAIGFVACGDRAIIGRLGGDDLEPQDAGADANTFAIVGGQGGGNDGGIDAPVMPGPDASLGGAGAGGAAGVGGTGGMAGAGGAAGAVAGAGGAAGSGGAAGAGTGGAAGMGGAGGSTGGPDAAAGGASPDAGSDASAGPDAGPLICPGNVPACGGTSCCQAPFACKGTSCGLCDAPEIACNMRCTNTAIDPWNCGMCGRVCPQGQSCVASTCVPDP